MKNLISILFFFLFFHTPSFANMSKDTQKRVKDAAERYCNWETSKFKDIGDLCSEFLKTDICKEVKDKDDLLDCIPNETRIDEIRTNASIAGGCVIGGGVSVLNFLQMINDVVVWYGKYFLDGGKTQNQFSQSANQFFSSAASYSSAEYQRSLDEISKKRPEYQRKALAALGLGKNAFKSIYKKVSEHIGNYRKSLQCLNPYAYSREVCRFIADLAVPPAGLIAFLKGPKWYSKSKQFKSAMDNLDSRMGPQKVIASGKPKEFKMKREDLDELKGLKDDMGFPKLSRDINDTIAGLEGDRKITVSYRPGFEDIEKTLTRDEFIEWIKDPKVSRVKITAIEPKPTKASPQVTTKVKGSENVTDNQIADALVTFKSGEVGRFRGNKDMMVTLAEQGDVKAIEITGENLNWIKSTYDVPLSNRGQNFDPMKAIESELGKDISIKSKSTGSDINGMSVYHGTLKGFEGSVKEGAQNVGTGFGGRGLYLAQESDRVVAENYAYMAKGAVKNRYSNFGEKIPENFDTTDILMKGTLNPDKDFVVGQFEVGRGARLDLQNGILPENWSSDPRLKQFMEEKYDILEIKNAQSNGLNLDTDRFFVVHERAGKDAIIWNAVEKP